MKEPEDDEIDEKEWLRAAASNPAFDFLKEPEEDVYTLADGKPFSDQGENGPGSDSQSVKRNEG